MNHGRNPRLFVILLFSAAVQAATPDPWSLASASGLWLFLPAIAQPDQPLDDDDSPDEVCEPAARQIDAIASHVDQLRRDFHLSWKIAEVVEPTTCSLPPLENHEIASRHTPISPPLLCRFDC